jgi:predicted dehydrogenase
MSQKEIKLGVIGTGGRGALAQHSHNPEDGVFVIAGADIADKGLKDFQERYGTDTFITKDYKELLAKDEIDAVFITSPDFLHEEHALAALNAGKHVYLEKPMAISIEGCDKILESAKKNGVKLYLGHNMRHMDVILKMKELIDKGAIGEVKTGWCRHFVAYGGEAYFKDWHAEQAKSNSLLLQKGAHDIDVLHWLCNGYSKRVTAMGNLTVYDKITDRHEPGKIVSVAWNNDVWPPSTIKDINPIVEVEDLSMMLMELNSGVLCSYQQCHYSPDAWRNYTIIGTEGRIENFGDAPGNCAVKLWNNRESYNPYGNEQYYIKPVSGSHGGADPRIVKEFIDYIRDDIKITTSPIAARYSVAAGCAAAHSLRNGNIPVDVPDISEDLADYFNKDQK